MLRKALFFAIAVFAGFLPGCATVPHPTVTHPTVLTIELYDSRAAVAVHPSIEWLPVLPTPALPETESAHAVPPTRSASAAAAEQAAPDIPLSPDTATPRPVDTGFMTPARPRAASVFALAVPAAPAAASATAAAPGGIPAAAPGGITAAIAPKASGSASAAPGGIPAAAPGGIPAATAGKSSKSLPGGGSASISIPPGGTNPAIATGVVPGSGSNATAGSGSAQGSSGSASASASGSYGRLREIYARQGDELQIGLDGTGFLFLGFPDSVQQSEGMSFKAKETRSNKTWFTFKTLRLGTYDLDFLQQDNSTGKSAKETVRVHVVSDQDFNAAVGQQPGLDSAGSGAVETGDPAFAERLTSLGSYEAAVTELLKGYKDGNPALNDQIASLYMRLGSYDAAGKYYGKNLAAQNAYGQNAVLGMVRIAVAQKDQAGLMASLKQFLSINDPAIEEPLIQAARLEKSIGETGVGLELAAEYSRRFPTGSWNDEAEFLMAQLLESDSKFRDITRARTLYRDILLTYPESRYADAARQRVLYIESHFFQVR